MKPSLQPDSSTAQEPQDDSPFLLTAGAARFLLFHQRHDGTERPIADAMRLFREWAFRNHVPAEHRGRTLLYDKSVLRAFTKRKGWTHGRQSGPRLIRSQR